MTCVTGSHPRRCRRGERRAGRCAQWTRRHPSCRTCAHRCNRPCARRSLGRRAAHSSCRGAPPCSRSHPGRRHRGGAGTRAQPRTGRGCVVCSRAWHRFEHHTHLRQSGTSSSASNSHQIGCVRARQCEGCAWGGLGAGHGRGRGQCSGGRSTHTLTLLAPPTHSAWCLRASFAEVRAHPWVPGAGRAVLVWSKAYLS